MYAANWPECMKLYPVFLYLCMLLTHQNAWNYILYFYIYACYLLIRMHETISCIPIFMHAANWPECMKLYPVYLHLCMLLTHQNAWNYILYSYIYACYLLIRMHETISCIPILMHAANSPECMKLWEFCYEDSLQSLSIVQYSS